MVQRLELGLSLQFT